MRAKKQSIGQLTKLKQKPNKPKKSEPAMKNSYIPSMPEEIDVEAFVPEDFQQIREDQSESSDENIFSGITVKDGWKTLSRSVMSGGKSGSQISWPKAMARDRST